MPKFLALNWWRKIKGRPFLIFQTENFLTINQIQHKFKNTSFCFILENLQVKIYCYQPELFYLLFMILRRIWWLIKTLYILRQFEFFILSLENDVMATSKRCAKLFSLIFILKCLFSSTVFLMYWYCKEKLDFNLLGPLWWNIRRWKEKGNNNRESWIVFYSTLKYARIPDQLTVPTLFLSLRGWLHGEFQPGLKFQPG